MAWEFTDEDAKKIRTEANALSAPVLIERIVKESDNLHAIFDQAGDMMDHAKVTAVKFDDGEALSEYVRTASAELKVLKEVHTGKTELENLAAANEDARKHFGEPVGAPAHPATKAGSKGGAVDLSNVKTLGDQFLESKGYKERSAKGGPAVDFDEVNMGSLIGLKDARAEAVMKTVMSTGAGFAPENVRNGDVVMLAAASQPTTMLDFMVSRNVNVGAVTFMRQSTRTMNAAEILESVEGTLKSAAESAEVFTEVSEPIRKINHFIPITDEQFEDEAQLAAIIDADMILGVRQRLNLQILVGDGSAPNIEGFLDAGRAPNTQALGADNVVDAIYKGITLNRFTGRVEPDAVVINPNDWQDIRLLTTLDGIYVFGPPSQSGESTLWGLPTIVDTDITEGTALTGGFKAWSYIALRRGVSVQISSEHASFFIQGIKAVLAEMRAGLVQRRENAFTTITGI